MADTRGEDILDDEGGDSLTEASGDSESLSNPILERPPQGALRREAGAEQISELLIQARDSIVMIEDSELQVLARISAEFNRSSDSGIVRDSAEALRDSEVDRLAVDSEDPELGETSHSELTDKGKKDISERVAVLPRTHLLANSIAPTAAIKSVAPAAAPPLGPFWQIVAAAAAVVGLGIGLGQIPSHQARTEATPAVEDHVVVRTAAAVQRETAQERVTGASAAEPAVEPNSLPVAHRAAVDDPNREQNNAESAAEQAPTAIEISSPGTSKSPAAARGSRAVRRKRAGTKPGQLPAQPSREQVVATMKAAMPALDRCAAGRRGSVSAQLTVRGSGRVSYALVQGSFAGTREGSCLVQALREVRFPAFSEPSLRLTYPLHF